MTFCHGEVGIPGVLKHGMLTGPVDKIWQHFEKIRVWIEYKGTSNHGSGLWNMVK
jgi:hypothetical protein